jgi:hypothetical protein
MDAEEAFESRMRLDGSHEKLRRLAAHLIDRFRPDATRMAEAAQLAPCGR